VNALKELRWHSGCGEGISDGQEEAGAINNVGFALRHMHALKSFCIKNRFSPNVVFHGFGGAIPGDVNSKVACALIGFEHGYLLGGIVGVDYYANFHWGQI